MVIPIDLAVPSTIFSACEISRAFKSSIFNPAMISIFEDRSFTFVLKTPPASFLLKKKANVAKGSGKNLVKKIGSVTKQDIHSRIKN